MKKIRKAVIPVAGMGTRFLPITKSVAKEMLPIIDKPTVQYIVEEAVESGIEEIIFIISPLKDEVRDYFNDESKFIDELKKKNKPLELELLQNISKLAKFHYVVQEEALGSGHAIHLAKDYIGNEPFAVLLGDDLMYYKGKEPVLKQLINIYEKNSGNVIGVQEVDSSLVYKYGIIEYNKATNQINGVVEKPKVEETPSNKAVTGRYIFQSEIFNALEKVKMDSVGEYQITDGIKGLMIKQPFYACIYDGIYCDIGSKVGCLEANVRYALDREELRDEVLETLKRLIN